MLQHRSISAFALFFGLTGNALADLANNPNPYAAGFGFDLPSDAVWGGWTRGAAGTAYAEWDTFNDASVGTATDRTAAPDVGSANMSSAVFSWLAPTFRAGSGNLYSFSGAEIFALDAVAAGLTGALRVALQYETWGNQVDPASLLLNGLAPTFSANTYTDPAYQSSFGPVTLVQHLAYWDLAVTPASFNLDFSAPADTSFAQVALDIGALPPTTPVPLPLPAWLFGAALAAIAKNAQRRRSAGIA